MKSLWIRLEMPRSPSASGSKTFSEVRRDATRFQSERETHGFAIGFFHMCFCVSPQDKMDNWIMEVREIGLFDWIDCWMYGSLWQICIDPCELSGIMGGNLPQWWWYPRSLVNLLYCIRMTVRFMLYQSLYISISIDIYIYIYIHIS